MKIDRALVAVILTALCVTLPLAIFGLRPVYLAEILLQANSETIGRLQSKSAFTRLDGNGVAFFDFRASVIDQKAPILYLDIRPLAEPKYYRQGDGYPVIGGVAQGIAQLGSKQWPLHQDEHYAFRLVDQAGTTYLDGKIVANVHAIAGSSQIVILFIGLFASVLQIGVSVWPRHGP